MSIADNATTPRLDRALAFAADGWHVFPAARKEQPLVERWEQTATTDAALIRKWWARWPNAFPGIAPDRTGHAVIDIDVHDDKPNGFQEADAAGAPVMADVQQKSTSGKGAHLWYRGRVGTGANINGITSVDSRGVGGYIFTHDTYELPPADSVNEELPSKYRKAPSAVEVSEPSSISDAMWLKAHDAPIGNELQKYLDKTPSPFRGRDVLHTKVYHLVMRGNEGSLDAGTALKRLRELWLAAPHNESPREAAAEFNNSLRSNIRDAPGIRQQKAMAEFTAAPTTKTAPAREATPEPEEKPEVETSEDRAAAAEEQEIEAEARRIRIREAAKRRHDAATEGGKARPPLIRLDAFLAIPDEPTPYIVEECFPAGGNIVLAAQFKAGKSTMVGNLIRSLVDGDPFLDTYTVNNAEGRRVLLIDNELDPRMVRRWLRDQGIRNTDRVSVVTLRGAVSTFNLLSPEVRASWAKELAGHDVVIFDCLRPVLDALGLSEDKEAGRFLTAFDELKGEAGIPEAVVVHHMGHSSDRSRGDSRLRDWPDAEWQLIRERDDEGNSDTSGRRFYKAVGRDVEIAESLLAYDAATRHLTLLGGSRKAAKAASAREPVLDLIRAAAGGLTGSQVEMMLTGKESRAAVRAALKLLEDQGVTDVSRGPRGANIHQFVRVSP